MAKIGTSCKNCCFFNLENATCMHDLLDTYRKRGATIDIVNGYPQFDRVCQYMRNDEWSNTLTIDDKIAKCNNEVYIRGTIILIATNEDNLLNAIFEINKNEKIKGFKFIILYRGIKYKSVLNICEQNIKANYRCISMLDDDINFHIFKSLKFAINGFIFILDSDKKFDTDCIDKINHSVNKKMYRILHVPGVDGIHQSVSMAHIYKFLRGDLQNNFSEKLINIAREEKSDPQVFTWKEINDNYCN